MAGDKFKLGRAAPTLGVADMDGALAFYLETLGFERTFANGDPVSFAIVKRDGAELHLIHAPDRPAPRDNVAHLMVDDAAAMHDHLQAGGVEIVKALRDADYGMRGFVFADPDGNRIDVGQNL